MSYVALVQIDVSQNADFADGFRLVQADPAGLYTMPTKSGPIACSPRDLTGSTLEAVVAPSLTFTTLIDRLTSVDIPIADAANGLAAFKVPASRVGGWPVGAWSFVMRLRTPGGGLSDVMRGPFIIHPRVFPS